MAVMVTLKAQVAVSGSQDSWSRVLAHWMSRRKSLLSAFLLGVSVLNSSWINSFNLHKLLNLTTRRRYSYRLILCVE